MLRGRRTGLTAAVLVLALAVASPAAAAWVVGAAAGDAAAGGTTVSPPTAPSATVTSSTVTLSWTPPATGATPSGYSVVRTGAAAAPVCTAISATTCTDTGLTPSTPYTYEIRSLAGVWVSPPVAAAATTADPLPTAFVVTVQVPTTVTAGTQLTLTIQARNDARADDPTYAGTHTLTFTGPGAVGGNVPSYPVSVTFDSNGLASNVKVTLYRAEVVTITVADPAASQRTGVSNQVTVLPRPANRLRWTTDAAGLIDACPSGTLVVGPGGQRSWYVVVLDVYGNRAIQGAAARSIRVVRLGGGGQGVGSPPTVSPLTIAANANPAVTSTTTTLKLKKKGALSTTYEASDNPLTAATCTLSPA